MPNESKSRTQITWKLDRLSKKQQEQANKWADQQQNIQTSVTNIILHMIDRYGYVDFMDFDVQKDLFKESFSPELESFPKRDTEEFNLKTVEQTNDKKTDKSNTNDNNDDDDDFYDEKLMNELT